MSEEEVTEVTTTSWFSRLGSAVKGVIIGAVMFIAGFPLLFWNEGRAVNRAEALKLGADAVIGISSDQIAPENEGKLVHFTGAMKTTELVTDSFFSLTAPTGSLQLIRNVEMYQWTEHKTTRQEKEVGGKEKKITTYRYEKTWSDREIDSSRFHRSESHENPPMSVKGRKWAVQTAKVGAFQMSESQIFAAGTKAALMGLVASRPLPANLAKGWFCVDGGFEYQVPLANAAEGVSLAASVAGSSTNAVRRSEPRIGDLRVTFQIVPAGDVSFVGRQSGNRVTAYTVKNGGTILLQENGIKDAAGMFTSAQKANATMTLILRLVGFALMFFGLRSVFAPLDVLADVVPFIGSIVRAGTGMVSFLISAAFSLLTIGIAWFFYRPLIGIPILVVSLALIIFAVMRCKAKKNV